LSLMTLFAVWALGLIFAFGALHWSLGTALVAPEKEPAFGTYLYLSGVTFFTLGPGDVTAQGTFGRLLTVAEAGIGFGFMATIIGYLPVLYQAFSSREVTISTLDARAGSPPSAGQFLVRLGQARDLAVVEPILAEWERWAAQVLESHLSFPVLSYYRSQHDNQSWLATMTFILDTCALLLIGVKGVAPYQAQLTFAMARHAVVDLALVFRQPPLAHEPSRLTADALRQLQEKSREAGLPMRDGAAVEGRLAELREMYEPFVSALGDFFLLAIPPIVPARATVDNWQTSAWTRRTPGIGKLPVVQGDDHFD
jgi:Ion channel